jgi:hypothetical protein
MVSLFDKDAGVILPPALLHGAALTNQPFFSSENNSVSEITITIKRLWISKKYNSHFRQIKFHIIRTNHLRGYAHC